MPSNHSLELKMLCDLLQNRIGAQNAIPLNDIADFIGLTRRATERLIEFHLPNLPFCVVADTTGYYRPITADEINHYRKTLLSRIKRLASRYRAVTFLALKDGWPKFGQFVPPSTAPLLTFNEQNAEAVPRRDSGVGTSPLLGQKSEEA